MQSTHATMCIIRFLTAYFSSQKHRELDEFLVIGAYSGMLLFLDTMNNLDMSFSTQVSEFIAQRILIRRDVLLCRQ